VHRPRGVLDHHLPAALLVSATVTANLGRCVVVAVANAAAIDVVPSAVVAAIAVHFSQAQLLIRPQALPDLQHLDAGIRHHGGGVCAVNGHRVVTAAARQRGRHVGARGTPVRIVDPQFLVVKPYGNSLGRHPLRQKKKKLLLITETKSSKKS